MQEEILRNLDDVEEWMMKQLRVTGDRKRKIIGQGLAMASDIGKTEALNAKKQRRQ
jgi:hypothetical protein